MFWMHSISFQSHGAMSHNQTGDNEDASKLSIVEDD
jgi:hypothetical protein